MRQWGNAQTPGAFATQRHVPIKVLYEASQQPVLSMEPGLSPTLLEVFLGAKMEHQKELSEHPLLFA